MNLAAREKRLEQQVGKLWIFGHQPAKRLTRDSAYHARF
jgi:hypothetical protein